MTMQLGTKLAIGTIIVSSCIGCATTPSFQSDVQPPRPRPLPVPKMPADPFGSLRSFGVYVVSTESGSGSGFSMSDTIIVTAYHVVEGAEIIFVEGDVADLLAFDEGKDVAVLRVPNRIRPHLELAQAVRGDEVRAVGYAGYGREVWATVVPGYVVGFAGGHVTFSGGIGPGMSGGPLLDAEGRVVGLASHAFTWQRWGAPNPTLANFVPPKWIIMVLAETPFYLETLE